MDNIVLSTIVNRPPEDVYPYLESFTEYPQYADHLETVTQRGDGGVGTRYDLHLRWWKLSYTARSAVTDLDPPHSLSWRLTADVDAAGTWRVEPIEQTANNPDVESRSDSLEGENETASRLIFEASYDPHSANADVVSLPRFVSMDWVIRRIRPRLMDEAERVVERLVADIEGTPRSVELTVHEMPGE